MLAAVSVEFFVIVVLVLLNGVFAASELAIVSARRGRLEQRAEEGSRGARQAVELAANPDRFLATVQIGITLVSTFAAAFGGASLGDAIAAQIAQIPVLAPYAETIALTVVIVGITYLSLVLGELVPKRLALQYAERLAAAVAPAMSWLAVIGRPFVALLTGSVNAVMWLLRQRPREDANVTQEDIIYMVREGEASGAVEAGEADMIHRAFRFADRPVKEVMTPRTEIAAIEIDTTLEAALAELLESGHSRLPVYTESLDRVQGIIHAKDALRALSGRNIRRERIAELLRPATLMHDGTHMSDALEIMRTDRTHIAIVVDEYGQTAGLVTLEDILDELVGDIQDEHAALDESAFVQREDGSWLVDGLAPYDEAVERTGLPPATRADRRLFVTVAGMVLARLGRIPSPGDTLKVGDHFVEVMDMDGNRIDRLLISPSKSLHDRESAPD